jgi:hypothetical protein
VTPLASISHSIPGRARLRIGEKRGVSEYFSLVKETLIRCPGVQSVETNPLTATVLIFYSGPVDVVLAFAAESGLFRVQSSPKSASRSILQGAIQGLQQCDRQIRATTDSRLDLSGMLFIALGGAALYQAVQGEILAPAVTLLWYALATLHMTDWARTSS